MFRSLKTLRYVTLFVVGLMVTLSSLVVARTAQSKTSNLALVEKSQPAATAVVTIQSFQFQPQSITVKRGGSVTFTNKDSTPHTVSPAQGAKFTGTGRLSANQSKTVVFNQVGTQHYFCEIHPSMKGTVNVVQ